MSWSGTVRCGYCYETGHNRRSCQQYTDYCQSKALRYGAQDLRAGSWNREYANRTGKNADGSPCALPAKRKKRRHCGWCKEHGFRWEEQAYGHNRQTCPHRKEWIEHKIKQSQELRAAMRSRIAAFGVGVGALIKARKYCYDEKGDFSGEKRLAIIEKIAWDKIDVTRHDSTAMTVRWVGLPKDPLGNNLREVVEFRHLPKCLYPESDCSSSSDGYSSPVEIVGKSHNPLATCPDDWEHRRITPNENNY